VTASETNADIYFEPEWMTITVVDSNNNYEDVNAKELLEWLKESTIES
jgi:hypothetical protein